MSWILNGWLVLNLHHDVSLFIAISTALLLWYEFLICLFHRIFDELPCRELGCQDLKNRQSRSALRIESRLWLQVVTHENLATKTTSMSFGPTKQNCNRKLYKINFLNSWSTKTKKQWSWPVDNWQLIKSMCYLSRCSLIVRNDNYQTFVSLKLYH